MKSIFLIVTALPALFTILMGVNFVFADKHCPHCMEFVIMTHEYRASVLNAAVENPDIIPELVENYSQDVLRLFNSSTAP